MAKPGNLLESKEHMIQRIKNSVEEEIVAHKAKGGARNFSHLAMPEKKDRLEAIKEHGWYVSVTDKSSMTVLELRDKYVGDIMAHTTTEKEVTLGHITELGDQLYDQTTAILRNFWFGCQHPEQADKIIQAMKPGLNGVS